MEVQHVVLTDGRNAVVFEHRASDGTVFRSAPIPLLPAATAERMAAAVARARERVAATKPLPWADDDE
jgi:hypothetical protein